MEFESAVVEDIDTKYDLFPVSDKIIVRPAGKKQTKSGLALPDNMKGDNILEGEVIAVGPGAQVQGDATKRHEMRTKVGQKCLFNRHSGTEIEINGEKLRVMHENEILVVLQARKS